MINYARTLIYTTALPFPCLASIQASYDFLKSGRVNGRIRHLEQLITRCHELLLPLCSQHKALLRVNQEIPKSPIIPLFTPHPRSLAQFCQARGYTVRPIVAPTVPKGYERVRICLHASNTEAQIEGLLGVVENWAHDRDVTMKSRL